MAEFLATKDIASRIDQIIRESRNDLVLISPFFQLSDQFYNRLYQASEREVDITIVFGKNRLKNEEFYTFHDLLTVELLYCHNLHAKCYFNEEKMVITSMNFYAYSEFNNHEMGVYVERQIDGKLYTNAHQEAVTIIRQSELIKSRQGVHQRFNQNTHQQGYCIRCQSQIPLMFDKPYCHSCYSTWNEFGNPNYQEKFCHKCGDYSTTSMQKPECYTCYTN